MPVRPYKSPRRTLRFLPLQHGFPHERVAAVRAVSAGTPRRKVPCGPRHRNGDRPSRSPGPPRAALLRVAHLRSVPCRRHSSRRSCWHCQRPSKLWATAVQKELQRKDAGQFSLFDLFVKDLYGRLTVDPQCEVASLGLDHEFVPVSPTWAITSTGALRANAAPGRAHPRTLDMLFGGRGGRRPDVLSQNRHRHGDGVTLKCHAILWIHRVDREAVAHLCHSHRSQVGMAQTLLPFRNGPCCSWSPCCWWGGSEQDGCARTRSNQGGSLCSQIADARPVRVLPIDDRSIL